MAALNQTLTIVLYDQKTVLFFKEQHCPVDCGFKLENTYLCRSRLMSIFLVLTKNVNTIFNTELSVANQMSPSASANQVM